MGKKELCQSFARSVSWGVVAIAIAFWMNLLIKDAFSETWWLLLIVPVVEEIAKYLGLRQTRSVIIPIVFLIGESVVQSSGYMPMMGDGWVIWLFYIPFSVVMFKHLLFYVFAYLCNFRIHGLLLAIAAHSLWNWYSMASKDVGMIPLSLITLLVVIVPVFALYRKERNDRSVL